QQRTRFSLSRKGPGGEWSAVRGAGGSPAHADFDQVHGQRYSGEPPAPRAIAEPYNHRMLKGSEDFMLMLLQACADCAPEPLYPARFAQEKNLDRDQLDQGLDELRRRGLVKLTDWVRDLGQGRALTTAGEDALKTRNLAPAPVAAEKSYDPAADETGAFGRGE